MTPQEPPHGLAPTVGVPPPGLARTHAAPAPFEPAAPPRAVGPYEVVRELGRGGMGVVYEVRRPDLPGRALALKLILGAASQDALERFGREAEVLARVRHRGVVTVHQLGRAPEGPYLVTDFVAGQGLGGLLRTGPLPARRAAEVVRELADALAAVHAQGVLHRDLKPDNVILREDGSPVLLDFGIARDQGAQRLTATGALLGTPAYMAPEQADGSRTTELDGRVDVYGLGAVLFALLVGRPPFGGATLQDVLKRVLLDEPEWPSRSDVPVALEAICRMAMARDREARYPSAAALRADLDRWLRGERPEAAARLGRRRGPLVAGGLALAALLAAGVGLALSRPPEPAPPPPRRTTPLTPPPAPGPPKSPWRTRLDAPAPARWSRRSDLRLVLGAEAARRRVQAAFLDDEHVVTVVTGDGGGALALWTLVGATEDPRAPREVALPAGPGAVPAGSRDVWLLGRGAGELLVASTWSCALLEVGREDDRPTLRPRQGPDPALAPLCEALAAVGDDVLVARAERKVQGPSRVLRLDRAGAARELFSLPYVVTSLAVRGQRLVAATANLGARLEDPEGGALVVHDLATGRELLRKGELSRQGWSADALGERVVVGQGGGQLQLLDLAGGEPRGLTWPGVSSPGSDLLGGAAHRGRVRALSFDPAGRLWSGGAAEGGQGDLRGWSAEVAPIPDRSCEDLGSVTSLDVSPSGRALVVGTLDGEARVWLLPAP